LQRAISAVEVIQLYYL